MTWLIKLLANFFKWSSNPIPTNPMEPEESPAVSPEVLKQPAIVSVALTNAQCLYNTAYSSIGRDMSPNDVAPDNLACMESLDGVWFAAFGSHLLASADRLSTARGYASMLTDPRLKQIGIPVIGCIVIDPTGTSTKGAEHGHTGIWGAEDVMSNDSNSGLWRANYTHEAWRQVFEVTLGFKSHYFLPV